MKPRKILLIIPELMVGGAQRSLSKLSMALSSHHDVWLVIFNRNNPVAYVHGGELLSLDVLPGSTSVHKLKAFTQRVIRLRKLKKELGIDVSISFLEGADYINILSKSADKVVLSIRGSKIYDETMHGRMFWLRTRILIPWLYPKADLVVAVNHGIARELLTQYSLKEGRIITIGNFYDPEEVMRLASVSREKNLERLYMDPVLITTGRLAPEKGLISLIRVFHGLKTRNQNLRLIIVGDGPQKEEIISTCRQLHLDVCEGYGFVNLPDVLLLGVQPNVFMYLKGASLYLMNSSSEGFPNGLSEAMICRVPVVSSDCPYGPREILAPAFPFTATISEPYHSPNGILMPMIKSEEDIELWIKTLFDLLERKEMLLQLAEKGYERMGNFDQRSVVSQWLHVLDDVISR